MKAASVADSLDEAILVIETIFPSSVQRIGSQEFCTYFSKAAAGSDDEVCMRPSNKSCTLLEGNYSTSLAQRFVVVNLQHVQKDNNIYNRQTHKLSVCILCSIPF